MVEIGGFVGLAALVIGLFAWTRADMRYSRAEAKGDIAELRSELKGDIGRLEGGIADLRTELKGDIGELRTELKDDIGELRTELKDTSPHCGKARLSCARARRSCGSAWPSSRACSTACARLLPGARARATPPDETYPSSNDVRSAWPPLAGTHNMSKLLPQLARISLIASFWNATSARLRKLEAKWP